MGAEQGEGPGRENQGQSHTDKAESLKSFTCKSKLDAQHWSVPGSEKILKKSMLGGWINAWMDRWREEGREGGKRENWG